MAEEAEAPVIVEPTDTQPIEVPDTPLGNPNDESAVTPDTTTDEATTPPDETTEPPADEEPEDESSQSQSLDPVTPTGPLGQVSDASRARLSPEIDSVSGALIYKYHIMIPPGRNGMTPDLSLVYNSSSAASDSVVGSGWDFDIPYLQRINKDGTNNLYSESYFSSSLDGELISLGSGSYGPKVENGSFNKYSLTSNVWTVTDKRGTVYKFGTNAAERQDNPSDSTKIFKWMLQEARDTNDNYITYEYYKDAGQIYPSKITYTGNGVTAGVFTVNFVRSARTGAPAFYQPGFSVKSNYRITEIRTEVNTTWARKYTLTYTTNDSAGGSLLNTITESGQDDSSNVTTLPAVDFDYKTSSSTTWTYNSSWSLPLPILDVGKDVGLRFADINGDGLLDLLCHNDSTSYLGRVYNCSKTSPKIYLNSGAGWTDASSTWLFPYKVGSSTDREAFTDSTFNDYYGLRVMDVNGDNLPDLVRATADNSNNLTQYVYINSGSGWSYNSSWSFPLPILETRSNMGDIGLRTADINGDGLLDILCSNDSNGAGQSFNCNRSSPKIYLNNGSGWTDVSSTWSFPQNQGNTSIKEFFLDGTFSDTGLRVMDVNGDGLADLVRATYASGLTQYVYLNNGSGWVYDSSWSFPLPFLETGNDIGLRTADINGDGLVDLICHNDSNGAGQSVNCNRSSPKIYLNTGGGWTDVSSTWSFPTIPNTSTKEYFLDSTLQDVTGLRDLDVNGDGITDLVRSTADNSNNLTQYIYLRSDNAQANLLNKVTYSQGGDTSITYKATPQIKDGSGNLLNPSLPLLFDVVSQMSNNSGSGTAETNDYVYEGGRNYFNTNLDHKFAGFSKVTKTDAASNKVITFYHQGNSTDSTNGEYDDHISKVGKAYRAEVQDSSGGAYQKTISKWDKYDLGNGRTFVKNIRTSQLTYDGDSDHKDKAEEYTYDNTYGNLTQKVEWGEVTGSNDGSFTDTGSDKFTTDISYAANTTPYIVGLPSQDTKTDQSSNKVSENKYYFDLQTLGSVTDGNLTKQEMWKTGSTYIDIEKTYNTTYGIVTSEKDPRDKTTSYSYDSYNLYPATVTNALSQATSYTYDYSLGKPKQVTDPNTRVYQTVYDGLDRVTAEKQPDLASPSSLVNKAVYTYTDTASAVKIQKTDYLDGSTSVDTYTYFDGLGRPIQTRKEMEDGNYAVTDTVYNSRGLVDKESVPYSSSGSSKTSPTTTTALLITYSYDPMQRVSSTVNAIGTTSNAYDDWKLTVTDPRSKTKDLYKDAYGNLSRVDEHNSASTYTTSYEYNGNNKLTKITDALSNIRNFTYDGLGRRLTAQDLHASGDSTFGTWTYTYDDSGNLTQAVDPKSQTINYTYDDLNRQSTEDYTGQVGTEVSYTYDSGTDGVGRLTSVTAPGANSTYAYDANGNRKQEVKTINSTNYQTDFTFDRQGNQLEITNPDSSKVKYTYNTAGQLETVQRKESTDGSFINVVTDFDYGPHGKVTYQAYQNGLATTNTYDSAKMYRLSNKQTATIGFTPSSNNPPTITFTGSTLYELSLNASWSEPGYSASDTEDGSLTSSVTVTGSVNTAVAGIYQLVYSVVDSDGAPAARKIRTVVVWPNMTVRALVVAGGGGGGKTATNGFGGGGGGAGGMQDVSSQSISEQAYTITVGGGGSGQSSNARGGNGGNSSFGSLIVSTGGGGGGGGSGVASGNNGGSGGGAGNNNGTTATGVSGQGNNGGSSGDGAGGGGAGAAGGNGTTTSGGNGGAGLASDITGTSVYYAGGGGGATNGTVGSGGNGGGGSGGQQGVGNGSAGTANKGGGGGGGPSDRSSGAGGSGVVIIRYKTDGTDGVSATSTGGTITTSGAYTIHTFTSSGTFTPVSPINSTNNSPTITLTGSDRIELTLGGTWSDPGYSASDTEDGSLTSSVTVTGSVNTSAAGTYQLVYAVLDSKGESAARKIRTVVVIPPDYFQDIDYTYDNNGNVTQIAEAAETGAKRTVDYTYDDLNRLTSATATNVASGQSTYTHSYTYSAIGNILTRTDAAGSYSYAGDQGSSTANPHAVTSIGSNNYTYDNNGNMLTETGGLSNTWDYNNRLTQAVKGGVTSTYAYDHAGQRVKLANGTTTTYYPSSFYNTDGTTPIKHIVTPDGETVATVKGTGASASVYSVHTDHLTGSNVVTTSAGAQEELMDYFPYGNIRLDQKAGSFSEQRKAFSYEYDADTQMSYAGARYYKSDMGRFISQDQVFLRAGFDLTDPQSLNAYTYARNNPLRYIDPDGKWFKDLITGRQSWNSFVLEVGDAASYLYNNSRVWKTAMDNPYATGAVVGVGGGLAAEAIIAAAPSVASAASKVTAAQAIRATTGAALNVAGTALQAKVEERKVGVAEYAFAAGTGALSFGGTWYRTALVAGGANTAGQFIFRSNIDPTSSVISAASAVAVSALNIPGFSSAPQVYKFVTEQVMVWTAETPAQVMNSGIQKSIEDKKKKEK